MTSIKTVDKNGRSVALVDGAENLFGNAQSALEFLFSVQYETGADRVAVAKEAIVADFFVLSTGLAGEILQKCVNYHLKLAIFGDYSRYTSKPLHDFILESNKGGDFFFVASEEEAVAKLCAV